VGSEVDRLPAELLEFFVLVQARAGGGFFARLDARGITLSQYRAMSVVARSPRAVTVSEVTARLSLSQAATSRAVDAVVRRGWMARTEDEHDRRHRRLSVTEAGRAVVAELDGARTEGLAALLADVPVADRAALRRSLAAVVAHLS
jgi:DNA-binding MarR family transcriptional regulator